MKKELLNEIMGVPKDITPWVEAFREIILDVIKDVSQHGWDKEGEIYFEDPKTGEQIKGKISKSENIEIDGKVFMDLIMEKMGFTDLKEFINSETFKKLPLWRPELGLSIISVPSAILSKEDGTIEASVNLNLDKGFSNLGKVKILSEMSFYFSIAIESEGVSNKDLIEIDETISHELLHAYQKVKQLEGGGFSHYGPETALNALSNNPHFKDINIKWWSKFLNLVYLHLSFEINARVNQLYYNLKRKDIKNVEDLKREIHKSIVWKEMKNLESFDAKKFLESFELPEEELDFSNPLALLHSLMNGSNLESMGVDTSSDENAIKSLIELWDGILSMGVKAMKNMGANITMDKVPQKAKEDPYIFFKFFEDRFHRKAENWKRKMYKVGSLILQEKEDSSLQS